jgi:hypothetical protein
MPGFSTTYTGGNLIFEGDFAQSRSANFWRVVPMLEILTNPGGWHIWENDFDIYATTTVFKAPVGDGTVLHDVTDDGTGGLLSLATRSTASDNDEAYLLQDESTFKFTASKPIYFWCRMKMAEAATNAGNFCIGLSSVGAADTLVDDGGGLVTDFDGSLFYKVDGTMQIKHKVSRGTTQSTATNVGGTFVSDTFYELAFTSIPKSTGTRSYSSTTCVTTPYIDGVVGTSAEHLFASAAAMGVLIGVKAGTAASQPVVVDKIWVAQKR